MKQNNSGNHYAIIDLGSNTIRLCVYEYTERNISTIMKQKEMVGLVSYVSKGILSQEGIEKACGVLVDFVELAKKLVDESDIHIFATASLRNINNRDMAVEQIHKKTGMLPDVLTGEEEALFDFVGASHQSRCKDGVLIDIGGGSTEFVLFHDYQPIELRSRPIGCLNLYQSYVKNFHPNRRESKKIRKEVKRQLEAADLKTTCPVMIGVGGTARAVNKLARALFQLPVEKEVLDVKDIENVYAYFKKPDKLLFDTIYKTIPERALTIMPGLILLRQAIKFFGCKTIYVNNYGVREGYLLERIVGGKK